MAEFGIFESMEDMRDAADNFGYVEGIAGVDVYDLIDNGHEEFLDALGEALVGSILLMDINWKLCGAEADADTVLFFVTGDASGILEDYFGGDWEEGPEDDYGIRGEGG